MTVCVFLLTQDGSICGSFAPEASKKGNIKDIVPEMDWPSLLRQGEHRIFPSLSARLEEKMGEWRMELFPLGSSEKSNFPPRFCCLLSSREERKISHMQDELTNLRHIIDAMPFGVAVIRRDKHVHILNKAALDLAGYQSLEEFLALGKSCQETFCPAPQGECPIWDKGNLFDKTERPFLLRDGSEIRVLKSAVPVEIQGETMMLEGIIDLRKQKDLERMAHTDPLTGVLNRQGMEKRLKELYARALQGEIPLSLLMMDLDNFKEVNDKYGHFVGDRVLRGFAKIMEDHLKEEDLLGRWGGDEFLIATPSSEEETLALGERIIQSAKSTRFFQQDEKDRVSLSLGIAFHAPGVSLYDLLQEADHFMYGAKRRGCGIFSSRQSVRGSGLEIEEKGGVLRGGKEKKNPL
ncbi:MAG TPA: diguanylate cyclase [Synergistaceae bacterium]|nr:diguanylate cyclase [Synergistaceae bacterium]